MNRHSLEPYPAPCNVAHVRGYILALENVLTDATKVLLWCEQTHTDPEALGRLLEDVIKSLDDARETLKEAT